MKRRKRRGREVVGMVEGNNERIGVRGREKKKRLCEERKGIEKQEEKKDNKEEEKEREGEERGRGRGRI